MKYKILLFYAIKFILVIFILSCHYKNVSTLSTFNDNNNLSVDTVNNSQPINSDQLSNCDKITNFFKLYLIKSKKFYHTNDTLNGNIEMANILDCYLQKAIRGDDTSNIVLANYFENYLNKYSKLNEKFNVINPNDSYGKILNALKGKYIFEVELKFFGHSGHDSMMHGDCLNTGIEFFNNYMRPNIETIDGNLTENYLKNFEFNNRDQAWYQTDCLDQYHKILYMDIITKWKEGKIVVKDYINK